MSDAQQITGALLKLATATAGKELDRAVVGVYVGALMQFDVRAVVSALTRMVLTSTWFPSVAEIVEEIQGSEKIRAANAWAALDRNDPATNETVRLLGGWRALGQTRLDKMHFTERRFLELFPDVESRLAQRTAIGAGEAVKQIENDVTKWCPVHPGIALDRLGKCDRCAMGAEVQA